MIYNQIFDWTSVYSNALHTPHPERWPDAWEEPARRYRELLAAEDRVQLGRRYAAHRRCTLDLFFPKDGPRGLFVFVHGGYWMSLDGSYWSHLAKGAVDRGFAVAIPTYGLCPEFSVAAITSQIGEAITYAAGLVEGPLMLAGHSAGGHLVSRMNTTTTPLKSDVLARLRNTVSIAGIHDLRPLLSTEMNETFRLDLEQARAESPALLEPIIDKRVCCWVGGTDTSEFVRQSALLANVWTGLGAITASYIEPDKHHFNVIDALADPKSPLITTLFALE